MAKSRKVLRRKNKSRRGGMNAPAGSEVVAPAGSEAVPITGAEAVAPVAQAAGAPEIVNEILKKLEEIIIIYKKPE